MRPGTHKTPWQVIYDVKEYARRRWEFESKYVRPSDVALMLGVSWMEASLALLLCVEHGTLGKREDGRYYWKL